MLVAKAVEPPADSQTDLVATLAQFAALTFQELDKGKAPQPQEEGDLAATDFVGSCKHAQLLLLDNLMTYFAFRDSIQPQEVAAGHPDQVSDSLSVLANHIAQVHELLDQNMKLLHGH